MRYPLLFGLTLTGACAGTLYSRFAGPVAAPADTVYTCVQAQLKDLGYQRIQYNDATHWFVAQKTEQSQISSGLYRKTVHVLDTQVKAGADGSSQLEITARTFDEYANAKGVDREERKAAERVQLDARTLGEACIK
jgi:hypothetical protein